MGFPADWVDAGPVFVWSADAASPEEGFEAGMAMGAGDIVCCLVAGAIL